MRVCARITCCCPTRSIPWESSEGPHLFLNFAEFLKSCCKVEVVAGSGFNEGNQYVPRYKFSAQEKAEGRGEGPAAAGAPTRLYRVTFQSWISKEDRLKIKIGGDVCCGPADTQKPEAGPFFEFVDADFSWLTFEGSKVEFQSTAFLGSCTFWGANLGGDTTETVSFEGADFTSADFVTFRKAVFKAKEEVTFHRTQLGGDDTTRISFEESDFTGAARILFTFTCFKAKDDATSVNVSFLSARLGGESTTRISFGDANFTATNILFNKAVFKAKEEVTFHDSELGGDITHGIVFAEADFTGAARVSFRDAVCKSEGVWFDKMKAIGTPFDFQGLHIPGSFSATGCVFSSGSNFAEMMLTGSAANGHAISFKNVVFEAGCHLAGADFGAADFKGADFKENSLSGAVMDQVKNLTTTKGIHKKEDVEMMKFIHEMVRTHRSLFLLLVYTAEPETHAPTIRAPVSA